MEKLPDFGFIWIKLRDTSSEIIDKIPPSLESTLICILLVVLANLGSMVESGQPLSSKVIWLVILLSVLNYSTSALRKYTGDTKGEKKED